MIKVRGIDLNGKLIVDILFEIVIDRVVGNENFLNGNFIYFNVLCVY